MLDDRLPYTLSVMLRPLIWPMTLKTKNQRLSTVVRTLVGVPQGDPSSPHLFNIFMDGFLIRMNINPRQIMSSLFVDDVYLMARAHEQMQQAVNTAMKCAEENQIKWTASKSYGIQLPFQNNMGGETLTNAAHATYLGVWLGSHGLTHHKLIERKNAAGIILAKITRVTGKWKTHLQQRRMFITTFVYSIIDYVLFLQPLTATVKQKADELERKRLRYILGINIPISKTARATTLTRMWPLDVRRRRHMIKMTSKFYGKVIGENATIRDTENWEIMSSYGTIGPFIKHGKLPENEVNLDKWERTNLYKISDEVWSKGNNFKRKIPNGHNLPPVFRQHISIAEEAKATRWYMNRIPGSTLLSKVKPTLSNLLAKNEITEDEMSQLDHILNQLINQCPR